MRYPDWLGDLGKRDEQKRAAAGLYPAKDGWYKTVGGRKRYIAKPMSLADVLTKLDDRVGDLRAAEGERPVSVSDPAMTLADLAAAFLAHLWHRHETGSPRRMGRRTYDDYADAIAAFVDAVGPDVRAADAGPAWFTKYARTISRRAASTRQRHVIYVTAFFNWAGPGRRSLNFYREAVRFGPDFAKPDAATLQRSIEAGSTLYSADDLNAALMAVRDCPLLLVVGLLGINCAYLPSDLTALPLSAVDLDAATIDFPRPKTGAPRRSALAHATVKAIRSYMAVRPAEADPAGPLLVRDNGQPFNRRQSKGTADKRQNHTNTLGVYWGQVTGKPHKGLRTTFATTADGSADDAAIDLVMGHVAGSVRRRHYVKRFGVDRLRRLTALVWRTCDIRVPRATRAPLTAGEAARLAVAARRTPPGMPTPG